VFGTLAVLEIRRVAMSRFETVPPRRKRSGHARLMLMGVAPLALGACSQATQEAVLYPDAEACIAAGALPAEQCRAAYASALANSRTNAPQYANRADCVADFGEAQCPAQRSGGFFLPLMSGFLIARALNPGAGSGYAQPLYRPRNGEWMTPGGYSVGRAAGAVQVDPAMTQPQRAATQTRAGFGTRAAARAGGSWGS
jgi:uncharacterized protein YgiB involved in biofilm formation